jgi:hypothetical protein
MSPRAAPAHFPYAHRTVEQVDHDHSLLDARQRECPRCGVPAGQWCRSPNGRAFTGLHNARWVA